MATKVPTKTGAMVWAWAMMYKSMVKTVILYRNEIWLVTEAMLKVLEGFHHRVAWRIAGMPDQRFGDGSGH